MINLVEISIEDAEQIFFAISVAEGEVGDEFKNLKAKLYKIFPEILVAHTEGERRRKAEMDNQTSKRREITEAFLKTVELGKPLLGQVVTWYLANEKDVRSHYSDEICFPFDLWKYGEPQLVTQLACETRLELAKGTAFDRFSAKRPDKEMVHGLISVLEKNLWNQRKVKV